MTPKSLLRHPRCVSSLADAGRGPLRGGARRRRASTPARVRRVVLTQRQALLRPAEGARGQHGASDVALVRLEQLYPFPAASSGRGARALPARRAELVWAQEEPRNMGAWRFVREQFLDGACRLADGRVPALRRPRGQRQPRARLAQGARAGAGSDRRGGAVDPGRRRKRRIETRSTPRPPRPDDRRLLALGGGAGSGGDAAVPVHPRDGAHQLDGVPGVGARPDRDRPAAPGNPRGARRHRQRRRHRGSRRDRARHRAAGERARRARGSLRLHRLHGRVPRRLHRPRGRLPRVRALRAAGAGRATSSATSS